MTRFDSCGWENDVKPSESFILEYNHLLWQGELFLHGFNEIPDEPYCCLSGDPFEDAEEQQPLGEVAVAGATNSSSSAPLRSKREGKPANLHFKYH